MTFWWDDVNIEHIARHGIELEEAEDALTDPQRLHFQAHRGPRGERRSAVLGKTESGRILFVVITKRKTSFRVVTAREASSNEKRFYRRG